MRKPKLIALSLLFLAATTVLAAGNVTTDLTITSANATGPVQGNWTLTATGTMSLAKTGTDTDKLNSYSFVFKGPGGITPPITYDPAFIAPTSGTSSPYTCKAVTTAKGDWQFNAAMSYTTPSPQGGTQTKTIIVNQPFTVQ